MAVQNLKSTSQMKRPSDLQHLSKYPYFSLNVWNIPVTIIFFHFFWQDCSFCSEHGGELLFFLCFHQVLDFKTATDQFL